MLVALVLKVLFDPADFPKTPMNLGKFSMPLGVLSSSWLLGTSLIMFLPTLSPGDVKLDSKRNINRCVLLLLTY